MIIIEGPDCTGKTTIAKLLSERYSMPYYHFTKESSYTEYLKLLCSLDSLNAVVDRWAFSEYPYSLCMGRKFAFSIKEWHNIVLLTLIQNPVTILCTHKPEFSQYSESQYLPYNKWGECLGYYKLFFDAHFIKYIEYDYSSALAPTHKVISIIESRYRNQMNWWLPMWKAGYGCIGSPNPDFLLVAERIGPNNVNNLPFQVGPTGHMLSDMLERTGTPLGKFAVTNMVKSFRRDPRPPNDDDESLLRVELEHLKPKKAIFMGSVAKQYGAKIAKDLGIEAVGMTHFGYFSHRGITDISPLCKQWENIIKEVVIGKEGNRPAVSFITSSI